MVDYPKRNVTTPLISRFQATLWSFVVVHMPQGIARVFTFAICLAICAAPPLLAQEAPANRAAEIERARDAKVTVLQPEEVSPVERAMRDFKDRKVMERFTAGYNGLRAKLGGLVTGGGFGFGPEYFREDLLNGTMTLRASAQMSMRGYSKIGFETGLHNLAHNRLTLDFVGSRRDYHGLNYYGPGPNSVPTGRSTYRLEDTSADVLGVFRPQRFVRLGASTGRLWVNVGPGADKKFASAERLYSPAIAPGIDRQTNFMRTSIFAQFDYRDDPLGPKAGGNYVYQITWHNDRGIGGYSFRRADLDFQQYIPFFNKTRRFALRAKGTFIETDAGQRAPFYLQPILGGSDDLRGYRFFRFSDRNMVVYNAEYQWEIFSGLEGAVFADAGKVMPKRSMLAFSDLESDVGFGLRFNARNRTFMRFDVAFSHEGFQVWFKFNDVFNTRRFGVSAEQPVY